MQLFDACNTCFKPFSVIKTVQISAARSKCVSGIWMILSSYLI